MQFRDLGQTGLMVSAVGLGCNNFGAHLDEQTTVRVVHAALDCGITFFDTAAAYGNGASEQFLGAALQGRRNRAVISTKFGGLSDPVMVEAGGPKGARTYIRHAVDAALQRLRIDTIDVFQLHRPDPETRLEETLAELEVQIRLGKVRHVGCSGFSATQLEDAAMVSRVLGTRGFISVVAEWSLLNRNIEAELVPAAERYGYSILPSFPLASGLLTGKVAPDGQVPADSRLASWASHFVTSERLKKVERIRRWAHDHDRSMVDVAIGWLAAQRCVGSVIAGATSPAQVEANAYAAQWSPSDEQLAEIAGL